jgi:hypothetical protein
MSEHQAAVIIQLLEILNDSLAGVRQELVEIKLNGAAAPELYAALEKVLNQSWDGPIGAEHHARKQAAAALAKARGE